MSRHATSWVRLDVRDVPGPLYPELVPLHSQQPERAGDGDEKHGADVSREQRRVPQEQQQPRGQDHGGGHRGVQEQAVPLHLSPVGRGGQQHSRSRRQAIH